MKRKVFNVQIMTSIVSKETYLFEKQDGDEVRRKKKKKKTVKIKGIVERDFFFFFCFLFFDRTVERDLIKR